jgi:hypothetical protein
MIKFITLHSENEYNTDQIDEIEVNIEKIVLMISCYNQRGTIATKLRVDGNYYYIIESKEEIKKLIFNEEYKDKFKEIIK